MMNRSALMLALVPLLVPQPLTVQPAAALEVEHYTVYCADRRIEISFWDLAQMIVRRGYSVCQFTTYTSYSDALKFAEVNFGGEGSPCTC